MVIVQSQVAPHCWGTVSQLEKLQNKVIDTVQYILGLMDQEIARMPREVGTCIVYYITHVCYLVAMPFKQAIGV